MLVDDSAVIRGLMSRWVEAERELKLVCVAVNGREAVRLANEHAPDVIVLDVEMPELDGLSAIPQLLAAAPRVRIVMASTLTSRNAEVTLKALAAGATDYIGKPETGKISSATEFKRELIAKILALGAKRAPARVAPASTYAASRNVPTVNTPTHFQPNVIVIGSSTGGPIALAAVIGAIGGRVRQPILITQHMPPTFTAIMAEHLSKLTSAKAVEARDGMPIKEGCIYIAPGDFHMRLARRHGALVTALDQSAPVNFCRPAVDPLFASASETLGANVLAVILTGMGQDGKRGAEIVKRAGGFILAQDEATSVVWGMPGAVVSAGLATSVRPLQEIGPSIIGLCQGKG
jgi:two-component system chemotaxis response regulator CheB